MRFNYDNIMSRLKNNYAMVSSGEVAMIITAMAAKIAQLEADAVEKKPPAPRKKKESDDG